MRRGWTCHPAIPTRAQACAYVKGAWLVMQWRHGHDGSPHSIWTGGLPLLNAFLWMIRHSEAAVLDVHLPGQGLSSMVTRGSCSARPVTGPESLQRKTTSKSDVCSGVGAWCVGTHWADPGTRKFSLGGVLVPIRRPATRSH
jgi:hypothetical protein